MKNEASDFVSKYSDDLEKTLENECIHVYYQLKDTLENFENVRSTQILLRLFLKNYIKGYNLGIFGMIFNLIKF